MSSCCLPAVAGALAGFTASYPFINGDRRGSQAWASRGASSRHLDGRMTDAARSEGTAGHAGQTGAVSAEPSAACKAKPLPTMLQARFSSLQRILAAAVQEREDDARRGDQDSSPRSCQLMPSLETEQGFEDLLVQLGSTEQHFAEVKARSEALEQRLNMLTSSPKSNGAEEALLTLPQQAGEQTPNEAEASYRALAEGERLQEEAVEAASEQRHQDLSERLRLCEAEAKAKATSEQQHQDLSERLRLCEAEAEAKGADLRQCQELLQQMRTAAEQREVEVLDLQGKLQLAEVELREARAKLQHGLLTQHVAELAGAAGQQEPRPFGVVSGTSRQASPAGLSAVSSGAPAASTATLSPRHMASEEECASQSPAPQPRKAAAPQEPLTAPPRGAAAFPLRPRPASSGVRAAMAPSLSSGSILRGLQRPQREPLPAPRHAQAEPVLPTSPSTAHPLSVSMPGGLQLGVRRLPVPPALAGSSLARAAPQASRPTSPPGNANAGQARSAAQAPVLRAGGR